MRGPEKMSKNAPKFKLPEPWPDADAFGYDYADAEDMSEVVWPTGTLAVLGPDHRVVAGVDTMEWATFFEKGQRKVAHDTVTGVNISTVFLGLNHSLSRGLPLWFETMVFGGDLDGFYDRYTTWAEAVVGHNAVVALVEEAGREAEKAITLPVERTRRNNIVL